MAKKRGAYYNVQPVSLRTSVPMQTWIRDRAIENGISQNAMINIMLEVGRNQLLKTGGANRIKLEGE